MTDIGRRGWRGKKCECLRNRYGRPNARRDVQGDKRKKRRGRDNAQYIILLWIYCIYKTSCGDCRKRPDRRPPPPRQRRKVRERKRDREMSLQVISPSGPDVPKRTSAASGPIDLTAVLVPDLHCREEHC
ncbi:hypothetical protein ACI65C_010692 [Semiaphis heraclei]